MTPTTYRAEIELSICLPINIVSYYHVYLPSCRSVECPHILFTCTGSGLCMYSLHCRAFYILIALSIYYWYRKYVVLVVGLPRWFRLQKNKFTYTRNIILSLYTFVVEFIMFVMCGIHSACITCTKHCVHLPYYLCVPNTVLEPNLLG